MNHHINPEDVAVTKTIARAEGNMAWHFSHHDPRNELLVQGMYDTEIPLTDVDVLDLSARQKMGSYPVRIVVERRDVEHAPAVREAIADLLPEVIDRFSLENDDNQQRLF
jgi:hypothetical protein